MVSEAPPTYTSRQMVYAFVNGGIVVGVFWLVAATGIAGTVLTAALIAMVVGVVLMVVWLLLATVLGGFLTWDCSLCDHVHIRRSGKCSRDYRAPSNAPVACRCPNRGSAEVAR